MYALLLSRHDLRPADRREHRGLSFNVEQNQPPSFTAPSPSDRDLRQSRGVFLPRARGRLHLRLETLDTSTASPSDPRANAPRFGFRNGVLCSVPNLRHGNTTSRVRMPRNGSQVYFLRKRRFEHRRVHSICFPQKKSRRLLSPLSAGAASRDMDTFPPWTD